MTGYQIVGLVGLVLEAILLLLLWRNLLWRSGKAQSTRCLFHSWSRWEQYKTGPHVLTGASYSIQRRTCQRCGRRQILDA